MPRTMLCFVGLLLAAQAGAAPARNFQPEDVVKEIVVGEPNISPDGDSVVYSVTSNDLERDEAVTHVWLAQWDGSGARQLTFRGDENESRPKFSPDGGLVGFLSSRDEENEETRLWLMPMAGGEAYPLAGIAGSVEDFAFSPDGKYLALVGADPDPELKQDADGDEIP
ncbi:MAG TPA: hypothetical protein VLA37_04150, partial [Sphingomonadaceae bacterium]|nr:hypothetical protein [Sphingomonadaceae bacterium]